MTNLSQVKSLIINTSSLNRQSKTLSQLKGEDFNIFNIFGLETKENKTHSNFISELLNPNGSHNLGNAFLKAFFQVLGIPDEVLATDSHVEIIKEFDFGNGRIDILLRSAKVFIAIENKIYANDQNKQLLRYCDYVFKSNREVKRVYYLTLDGRNASNPSKGNLNEVVDYFPISYYAHINNWLVLCLKEASDFPIIRETIKQYLILIRKLTGQLTNQKMNKDLLELITKDDDSLKAAILIKDNCDYAINALKQKEIANLKQSLLKSKFREEDLSEKRSGRPDGLFIRVKGYVIDGEHYELGINIELDNDYYFFCMVKKGQDRIAKHNNDQKFYQIRNHFDNKIKGTKSNNWALAFSKNFNVGVNREEYFHNSVCNTEIFETFAKKLWDRVEKLLQE